MVGVFKFFPNAIASIPHPPLLVILSPEDAEGWSEQYTQEGYDVIQLFYPLANSTGLTDAMREVSEVVQEKGKNFGLITFGLNAQDTATVVQFVHSQTLLKACAHYVPTNELIAAQSATSSISTVFHLAASQETLHAALMPIVETARAKTLTALNPVSRPPFFLFTYPLVPATPAFPLLTRAPAALKPEDKDAVDPHLRSAVNISYTRTLEVLRRELGPVFDLESAWQEHLKYEFSERDSLKTMQTMVSVPYVNHIPVLTGGMGYDELARFYKYHFVGENITPPDTEMVTVSRTIGVDRIIDEMIFKCTHTTEIDYIVPGIPPTGKRLEIPLVGVVAFRGDKLYFEHIYWDQASVLVQLGLLNPVTKDASGKSITLPVAGSESAEKVLNPFGAPSNKLLTRWNESEGKGIE